MIRFHKAQLTKMILHTTSKVTQEEGVFRSCSRISGMGKRYIPQEMPSFGFSGEWLCFLMLD
jgi:hypothetical protein